LGVGYATPAYRSACVAVTLAGPASQRQKRQHEHGLQRQSEGRSCGKLVAIAKSGREELEENLRRDREARGQSDPADWR
jgi:hypothetical protein